MRYRKQYKSAEALKEQTMRILIDADACPVVRITEQVAKEKLQRGDHGGSWSGCG